MKRKELMKKYAFVFKIANRMRKSNGQCEFKLRDLTFKYSNVDGDFQGYYMEDKHKHTINIEGIKSWEKISVGRHVLERVLVHEITHYYQHVLYGGFSDTKYHHQSPYGYFSCKSETEAYIQMIMLRRFAYGHHGKINFKAMRRIFVGPKFNALPKDQKRSVIERYVKEYNKVLKSPKYGFSKF